MTAYRSHLLQEDVTCWRRVSAGRAGVLVDMSDYFLAARAAMKKARRSIHLLNWAFDPDTLLDPQPGCSGDDSDRIGRLLNDLACANPDLDVRVLCWKSALPVAATQNFFPFKARKCFAASPVKFVLDGRLPVGACHHQKMIIIDDAVAFCGGGDIGPDRWDTCEHLDDNPRREKTPSDSKCFDSRHEVMSVVDGEAAAALGHLFRDRWRRATGERLPVHEPLDGHPWPDHVEPMLRDVHVGLSRTVARWRTHPEIRENEALYLASIAAARTCIYLENQYFTSPVIAEALAARLASPTGPEVVLVSTQHSPSYFDQMTMDRTRSMFIKRLKDADKHGRFRIYSPVTTLGRTIIVHAKIAIIDDRMLRIGSSNMNNRSAGFDTECDLTLECAETAADNRAQVAALRTRILAHWLGCPDQTVADALGQHGSVGQALEALRLGGYTRLRPIEPKPISPLATFIATFHIGDPTSSADSWRPWKRRVQLKANLKKAAQELKGAALASPPARLKPETV